MTKRIKIEKLKAIFAGYTNSILQDFERYSKTEVDLVENDIRLVLDEYKSSFITYKSTPGIYTFKDNSEVLLSFFQHEHERYPTQSVLKLMILPCILN